ncbi:Lsr2 dimerization domain-containing protein [Pilimelia columellifera]
MAKQIMFVSDISGEIGASTVPFAFDGRTYEVDLTEREEHELRNFLTKYIEAGVATGVVRGASGRAEGSTGDGGRRVRRSSEDVAEEKADKERKAAELAAVRAWAAEHYQAREVAPKGRVPKEVIVAYRTWMQDQVSKGGRAAKEAELFKAPE